MSRRTIAIAWSTVLLLFGCEPAGNKPAPAEPSKAGASAPSGTPAASPAAPAGGASASSSTASSAAPTPAPTPASAAPNAATQATQATPAAPGGAVKTPSGLEYTVLKEGAGATPALGSKVKVHVTGWLPNGKVFLDTRATNIPKECKLDSMELIKGWVDSLLTMREGEKRKIHVPSALAYGIRGYGEAVPPRTDLDFELELLSFTPPGAK